MSTLDPKTPIGRVVAERPASARLFERIGVDYCCGGDRSLDVACAEEDLDATTVIQMLETHVQPGERDAAENETEDWANAPLGDLIDHIESTHHAYLRRELPRLEKLLEKVSRVHGTTSPWIASVKEIFSELKPSMEVHIEKEEDLVFPFIRKLDKNGSVPSPEALGADPIGLMEEEHDETGAALKRIRTLSREFTPPSGACHSFREVLRGLVELETDTHRHVHKENCILFPRAQALM